MMGLCKLIVHLNLRTQNKCIKKIFSQRVYKIRVTNCSQPIRLPCVLNLGLAEIKLKSFQIIIGLNLNPTPQVHTTESEQYNVR